MRECVCVCVISASYLHGTAWLPKPVWCIYGDWFWPPPINLQQQEVCRQRSEGSKRYQPVNISAASVFLQIAQICQRDTQALLDKYCLEAAVLKETTIENSACYWCLAKNTIGCGASRAVLDTGPSPGSLIPDEDVPCLDQTLIT